MTSVLHRSLKPFVLRGERGRREEEAFREILFSLYQRCVLLRLHVPVALSERSSPQRGPLLLGRGRDPEPFLLCGGALCL